MSSASVQKAVLSTTDSATVSDESDVNMWYVVIILVS